MPRRPRKIAIGFSEVSGFNRTLKAGFQALGVSCRFYNLFEHPFGYTGADDNWLTRWIRGTAPLREQDPSVIHNALKWILALWMGLQYDAIIISKNCGLFPHFGDVKLWKWMGKTVLFQFHGSDSRPPYLNGALLLEPGMTLVRCRKLTQRYKRRINRVDRLADIIIDSPFHAHFHQRPVVNRMYVGRPYQPPQNIPSPAPKEAGTIVVLHCPSKREGKGSPVVARAMAALCERYSQVRYVEIFGRPNQEVLSAIQAADIVVDQVYNDIGFSGFATEAASFGKPVVMSGYPYQEWEKLANEGLLPTFRFTHPDTLEQAIETLILDEVLRKRLGGQAKAFLTEQWSPKAVAGRYLELLALRPKKGVIPPEKAAWYFQPQKSQYVYGWGLTEERARQSIQAMVIAYGAERLELEHAPKLKESFIAFAGFPQPESVFPIPESLPPENGESSEAPASVAQQELLETGLTL